MLKLKLKKLKFFGEKIVKKNSGKSWEKNFEGKKTKKKISQGYFRHFPCHFGNLLTWQ